MIGASAQSPAVVLKASGCVAKSYRAAGDWQSLRSDGTLTLDDRCIMETDDGHSIGITYRGMRHHPKEVLGRIGRREAVSPSEYYMRTAPFFGTGRLVCSCDVLNAEVQAVVRQRDAGVAGVTAPIRSISALHAPQLRDLLQLWAGRL